MLFTELRAPKLCNLRMDPFERAESEHAVGTSGGTSTGCS
jgi:hypothetical protein